MMTERKEEAKLSELNSKDVFINENVDVELA